MSSLLLDPAMSPNNIILYSFNAIQSIYLWTRLEFVSHINEWVSLLNICGPIRLSELTLSISVHGFFSE